MRTSIKITLFVVFFLAVGAIGVAIYMYNLKPAELQNVPPDYTMASSDLLNAFVNDEAGANEKYVNKVIEVSGEVLGVVSGQDNSYSISLKTGGDPTFIICALHKTEGLVLPRVGEDIIIRGTCSGYLMDILMNNCVIIKK
jgi:hypothetical protein